MVVNLLARHDDVPLFMFVMIFGGVGVLILTVTHHARQKRLRFCEELAGRVGGRFRPADLFSRHQIQFALLDRPCVLEFRDGKHPYSHLTMQLPGQVGGWLKISDNGAAEFFLGLFKGPRFATGDRNFDDAYTVRGWPEHLVGKVFSPGRRIEAMRAVRRLNHCAGYSLEVKSGRLDLRIRERVDDIGVGMAMVRTAEDFLRFLFDLDAVTDPGIQWGESRERLTGLCAICTTVLREPLVRCGRCQSPFHQECWDYTGRCATYGCDPKPGRRSA